jgi:hypothetical protein
MLTDDPPQRHCNAVQHSAAHYERGSDRGACSSRMCDDREPHEKASRADDNDTRIEEAKRVVKDYARGLREMLQKLRRWFH